MADIEVYVDGIASMQIQNLNSLVDTVRHEIIERYRPGEDDPHLRILQAALYCKRLGINYNKLSDAEFRQLVHILEKSKFFKSYVSQRKKRKWKLPLWEWAFLQRQFWIGIYDF